MTPRKRFPALLLIFALCLVVAGGAAWIFSPPAQHSGASRPLTDFLSVG